MPRNGACRDVDDGPSAAKVHPDEPTIIRHVYADEGEPSLSGEPDAPILDLPELLSAPEAVDIRDERAALAGNVQQHENVIAIDDGLVHIVFKLEQVAVHRQMARRTGAKCHSDVIVIRERNVLVINRLALGTRLPHGAPPF